MLSELSVRNFALIEELGLSFSPGFNVLTGETGAGKSIIVGAISLILGGRASSDLIRQGAEEAEVQALFLPADPGPVNERLEKQGLPGGDEVIVRRVLARSGRNRVYINGSLATLAQLAELGRELVAVSGQHEHQQLLDPDRQLLFLDQYGGLLAQRTAMAAAYEETVRLAARAGDLERRIKEGREKAELFEFQAREIEAAALIPGEDEDLEKERALVRNAEKIFTLVKEGYDRLYGESGAVIEGLDAVRTGLSRAAVLDERLSPLLSQVEEAYHQLDDVSGVLRGHLDLLTFDPARLEEIEDRLAALNKLKRKYGPNLADVMDYGLRAAGRLEDLAGLESELKAVRTEGEKARDLAATRAGELSRERRRAAEGLARELARELGTLGMPKVRFEVRFAPRPEGSAPGPLGYDEIEFLFSPNVGEELRPLARIASGGELSRATLALKSLLAGQDRIQTVIFDEVDAGIGGTVAEVVGRKLKELSRHHQLLCITHLPQIAMYGRRHHQVFKEIRGKRTITGIRPLAEEEKVEEIARMLGGLEPTEKTRAAAREMLARAEAS
ncbi:MAG: DNA repair protein RecN [Thermodesulfobacteriota bacterium]